MEDLIKLVAEKTGITTSQATMAVETVAGYIKTKLPAGMQGTVDSMLKGGSAGDSGDMLGGLKDKMGGMFGH